MRLTAGTRIGPYEIRAPIGAGGMGEVYRATDTKLDREVAIKILPAHLAQDPERLVRFEREAKVLASLNHPKIAQIYGVEECALVMELVPGQTLAERIAAGPVAVAEALRIAAQIAEALAAAHDRGVIHRDLKPANVKVAADGSVKVLDFGLAKSFAEGSAGADSGVETLTAAITQTGGILGTTGYMSPEQTRGGEVDKRTDIWSLGCVLFELLTRRRTFFGETPSDTIAAVLEREPDWEALSPAIPPRVRDLVRRCLRKDVRRRARDAGDIAIEIEEILAGPAEADLSRRAAASLSSRWPRAVPLMIAALVIAAALAGGYIQRRADSTPTASLTRLTALLPPNHRFATGLCPNIDVAPDGKSVAYIGVGPNGRQLFLRVMDSLEATALPGTEGASDTVFFSPDGLWVGFLQGNPNVLKKVSISGGLPVTIGNTQGCGGYWGLDDQILIGRTDGIFQIPAGGGDAKTVIATEFTKGERGVGFAQVLPDGKSLLFEVSTDEGAQIVAQRLATREGHIQTTGERHVLVRGDALRVPGSSARYIPGVLVYSQVDGLMAAPFDLDRLELTGPPARIALAAGQIGSQFGLSRSGETLVYVPSEPAPLSTLVWVNRKGEASPAGAPPGHYSSPRLSPDGSKVALAVDADIWVYDLARRTLTRITFSGDNRSPIWTPDGKRIAYTANGKITWSAVDRSTNDELLLSDGFTMPTSWSPDGKRLLFLKAGAKGQRSVAVLSVEGERKVTPVIEESRFVNMAVLSPDGRRMAYLSNESARSEVYVQEFPGPGGKVQISSQGATEPVWSRQGRELFYRNGDKMMVVDIAPATFQTGGERVLFEGRYNGNGRSQNYDISADGKRFLMVKSGGAPPPVTQLNVILNWAGDMKHKAGAK